MSQESDQLDVLNAELYSDLEGFMGQLQLQFCWTATYWKRWIKMLKQIQSFYTKIDCLCKQVFHPASLLQIRKFCDGCTLDFF